MRAARPVPARVADTVRARARTGATVAALMPRARAGGVNLPVAAGVVAAAFLVEVVAVVHSVRAAGTGPVRASGR